MAVDEPFDALLLLLDVLDGFVDAIPSLSLVVEGVLLQQHLDLLLQADHLLAVLGCTISSNCAKEWSGTKKELLKKAQRIEESVRYLVKKHRETDEATAEADQHKKEKQSIKTLKAKAKKIRAWLEENEERSGAGGKPIKSNLTDNESAKMPISHGVIQGYNGIATVDEKCQVIVDAQAFGEGHEAKNLEVVVKSVRESFRALEKSTRSDVCRQVVLTADSGFHSEQSVKGLLERRVDVSGR
jgi:hypothetical protein